MEQTLVQRDTEAIRASHLVKAVESYQAGKTGWGAYWVDMAEREVQLQQKKEETK